MNDDDEQSPVAPGYDERGMPLRQQPGIEYRFEEPWERDKRRFPSRKGRRSSWQNVGHPHLKRRRP